MQAEGMGRERYADLSDDLLRERLALAEDVCLMYGWSSGAGDHPRDKALYMLWSRWHRHIPEGFSSPGQHPHLNDAEVYRMAQERDETERRTLAKLEALLQPEED